MRNTDWKKLCPKLLDIRHKRDTGRNTRILIDCPSKKSINCRGQRWVEASSTVLNATRKNILLGICHPCSSWTGGIDTSSGYRVIRMNGKQIREHRYVMEKHLGRKLAKNEDVHHRNGNRADNKISNLRVTLKSKHHSGITEVDAAGWLKSLGYSVQKL